MYGKIFDSIFDSTLVADGGFLPTYTFMSMISIADKDGFVEVAPMALYLRLGFHGSNIDFNEFESAIKYLEKVDSQSHSLLHDGKRILPLDQMDDFDGNRGWLIVNYQHYREKASKEEKRKADRERIAKKRRSRKVSQKVAKVAYTDTDTDTKIKDLFSYWQQTLNHKKALLDPKRKSILAKALNDYGFDDCKKAIKGCGYSSWHMGDNDRKTVYDGLHIIFKDANNTETFINITEPQKKTSPNGGKSVKAAITARIKAGPYETDYKWPDKESFEAWQKLSKAGYNLFNANDYQINQAIGDTL